MRRLSPRPPAAAALAGAAVLALALAPALGAAEVAGRVTLLENGRPSPEVRYAVVTFRPAPPPPLPPAAPADEEPFEVVTVRKEFQPRVAVVPRGSTVRFPNQDPILHNVFSVTPGSQFDLGLVRQGESGEKRFERPGVVQVFCNVHHSMVAYVVVAETPHHAYVDRQGGFRLAGLPSTRGTLTVWHERADPVTVDVGDALAAPLEVRLEVTKPRIPPHNNKQGRPYTRSRRRGYG